MAPALWLGRGHPSNRWISVDRYDLMRDCKICVDNLFVFTLARNPNRQKRTRVIARTMGEDFAVAESRFSGPEQWCSETFFRATSYLCRLGTNGLQLFC